MIGANPSQRLGPFAAAALVCVCANACDSASDAPNETRGSTRPTATNAAPGDTPPALSPIPKSPAPTPPPPATPTGEAPPELGCRSVGEQTLGRGLGPARMASGKDGVWIAAYAHRDGERRLARFLLAPGTDAARALPERPLGDASSDAPRTPPGIDASGPLWIGATDAKGTLFAFSDARSADPKRVAVAKRVDARFPPAVRALAGGRALIAWTEGDATGMRVKAARLGDAQVRPQSITPLGHGATAPHFILGEAAPRLIMLDARAGVSPLLAVPFNDEGRAGEVTVWRPVSQPYAPPSIVAIALPARPVQVAYTAIGHAATAAVGIVRVDTPDPPQALLPGHGYALLSIDAALGPTRAVFVMDAPQTDDPAPKLEVHVRVWDGEQAGPPLVLPAERASDVRPAITYDATRGLFAVSRVRGDALLLSWLRCDA